MLFFFCRVKWWIVPPPTSIFHYLAESLWCKVAVPTVLKPFTCTNLHAFIMCHLIHLMLKIEMQWKGINMVTANYPTWAFKHKETSWLKGIKKGTNEIFESQPNFTCSEIFIVYRKFLECQTLFEKEGLFIFLGHIPDSISLQCCVFTPLQVRAHGPQ